jgi:hypothetical protein
MALVFHSPITASCIKLIQCRNGVEFNDYNGTLFNIRARALNNLVYWIAQIFGSVAFGFLLDQKRYSRRLRAWFGWFGLLIFVFFTHVWAYEYQK